MSKFVIEPVKRRVPYLKGKYRFTLVADNGEVVSVSETYNTRDAARDGVTAVITAAATAFVVERP